MQLQLAVAGQIATRLQASAFHGLNCDEPDKHAGFLTSICNPERITYRKSETKISLINVLP